MNTTRRCAACGLEISPSLTGKYCYNHKQIFDSLVAEHKAFFDANNYDHSFMERISLVKN
jgi:L-rhamnose mutarotase